MGRYWTLSIYGLILFAGILSILQPAGATPPHVKESAPTEVTFLEDVVYVELNLYSVFGDEDPEDIKLNFTYHHLSDLMISINETSGNVSISPNKDFNGEVKVTFEAIDWNGSFANHEMLIIILPINDPPEIVRYIPEIDIYKGDYYQINVSSHFRDVDDDVLFYQVIEVSTDAYSFNNLGGDLKDPWIEITCQDPEFYGYFEAVLRVYDRDPIGSVEQAGHVEIRLLVIVMNGHELMQVEEFSPNESKIEIDEMGDIVFEILQISDTLSYPPTYTWYVDGTKVPESNSSWFRYPQEVSFDTAGVYKITVDIGFYGRPAFEVSSTPLWTLMIRNVNQPPSITMLTPSITVIEGGDIHLEAMGADPDWDILEYRWYLSDDLEVPIHVGADGELVIENLFSPGEHTIQCYIFDGKDTSEPGSFSVTVLPEEEPTMLVPITLAACVIGGVAIFRLLISRRGHSKAY
jgi:hypothetical protein